VQQTVIAPGLLVGTRIATVGTRASGRLAEISVRPGDAVQADDVLARVDDTDARSQVAQAEINLGLAELQSAELTKEPDAEDLAAAQANLTSAEQALQALLASPSAEEVIIAKADLQTAEIDLQEAQAAYDEIAWQPGASATSQAMELWRASIAYEKAKANYDLAVAGPTEEELAAARAKVADAQAQLDALLTGASSEELEAAQLDVEQARNNLATAQTDLEAAALRAPFDGVVLDVKVNVGDTVPPGTPVIFLTDPTAVEVRSTVIEEDLPLVQVGQPVELFFDAEPDAVIQGQVARIVPQRVYGEDRPLYHVYIALGSQLPETLVPGMTADASIIIAQQSDVLRLPRALVRARSDGTAQVEVWTDGQVENCTVRVGLRGDVYIAILEGLREGEQVVGQ
jgi:HlyD family secretion protein